MNYALHAEAIVDGLGKNYANLQAVVEICQFFVSKLSTVIDSTNQILIPGAGIMERRHQWNVYRLPRLPLASLTESRSSLAESFFQTSLGACSQARNVTDVDKVDILHVTNIVQQDLKPVQSVI